MKILIVNTWDIQGGAARAAYRLNQALLNSGVDSVMLVQAKRSDSNSVIEVNKTLFRKILHLFYPGLDRFPTKYYKNRSKTLFSPAWLPLSGIVEAIELIEPDIVHLHWICDGMIRIEDLSKINKPIIWSLHDMWAFTGGCHYDEGCGKYKSGCCSCPVLGSKKANDLSRSIFTRKQRTFSKMDNLTIVGLSKWLADCARKSTLFADKGVMNLPNPLDTTQFAPLDKEKARIMLNLPSDKKLILFGAMSATSDPRKGYIELVKALGTLSKNEDAELLIFGSNGSDNATDRSFPTHYLGSLDEESLHLLYCAADVMVVPSLQENLSNTIMESLSCGTPVVAFNVGGNCDLIDHKQNGYLAEPNNPDDLGEGIQWVLNSPDYTALSHNARGKILEYFDSNVVAKQYIELYMGIIGILHKG